MEAYFILKKWDDSSIEIFIKEHHEYAMEAFLNARNHAELADID